MRRVVLIGNPAAGRGAQLDALREPLLGIAAGMGWRAELVATGPEPGSAASLAVEAARAGVERVLACGGDGTVHDVLQGVAGSGSALGVVPLGTANALARNLGLPLEPLAALQMLLSVVPRRVPLGWAENAIGRRWFAVLAGAGPDGALAEASAAHAGAKQRWGRNAYYGRAARLLLTRRFAPFRVRYREHGVAVWQETEAAGVMAARVPSLGGFFHGLTSASRLEHPFLTVQVLRPPAHVALAAWFASTHLRLARHNPLGKTLQVQEMLCEPLPGGGRVAAQVDAESFGELPLRLGVEPDVLSLLAPNRLDAGPSLS